MEEIRNILVSMSGGAILALVILAPAVLGAILAVLRGRNFLAGFMLGFFLSWLGAGLCLFLPGPVQTYQPRPRARRRPARRRRRKMPTQ